MTLSLDVLVLGPALAPALGVVLVLVLDALVPGRRLVHAVLGAAALLAGTAATVPGILAGNGDPARTLCTGDGTCLWSAGPLASTLQAGALATSLAALVLLRPGRVPSGAGPGTDPAVATVLVLASASGAVAVAAAHDLASWLIALELSTLPVVALVALRGTRYAGHGALSLLTTALFSFGLLVLGAALWLTATGDPTFSADAVAAAWAVPEQRAVLLLAAAVLVAGVGFKLSVVPFHAWTPQVYAGASLPVTALLASASKIGALAALVVVLEPFAALPGPGSGGSLPWSGAGSTAPLMAILAGLALISMLLGTVTALRQDDAVRLIAWSSVAQGGWVVLPLAALDDSGGRAGAAYVLTYAVAAVVALAVVGAVGPGVSSSAPSAATGSSPTPLAATAGLLRTKPLLGGPLALALLVLAGLPPGVIGLVTKVLVLRSVVDAGLWPLAVAAVVAAVLGVAVYVRWFAVLLAGPTTGAGGRDGHPVPLAAGAVIGVGTVLLGLASLAPQTLLSLLS